MTHVGPYPVDSVNIIHIDPEIVQHRVRCIYMYQNIKRFAKMDSPRSMYFSRLQTLSLRAITREDSPCFCGHKPVFSYNSDG